MLQLLALLAATNLPAFAAPAICPDSALGETAEDCPWAAVARAMIQDAATQKSPAQTFHSQLPRLTQEIQGDSHLHAYQGLWGTSINYDELAHGIVVDPAILAVVEGDFFGTAPARPERLTPAGHPTAHAGAEHTYGYLFSNLKTPFGYKRARWVRDDLERGLGLPRKVLGPDTHQGSLFANATYLAGRIAFASDAKLLRVLARSDGAVATSVRGIDFAKLAITRLDEKVELAGGRVVHLRTDLVAFPKAPADPAANSHLLVYSVADSAAAHPMIITLFPVQRSFVDTALKAANLGSGKLVQTRYNAFVDGMTDVPNLRGDRVVH